MRPLRFLLWLLALALVTYFGWRGYTTYTTGRLQTAVDSVIARTPALKGYPTRATVEYGGGRIDVSGLAPSGATRTDVLKRLGEVAPAAVISETIGIVPGAESAHLADEAARTRERLAAVEARLEIMTATLAGLAKSVEGVNASLGTMARAAAIDAELQSLRQEIAALAPKPDPRAELEHWLRTHAIFFSEDTTYSAPERTDAALDALAKLMRGTDTVVRIVGYTDERGSNDRNLSLAQARADRVAADLARRGIDPSRLKTVGRTAVLDISQRSGASSPNRRVAFEPAFVGEVP
jgi:outer membrane protein OmpA-like peptidoglycan-associated protein